MRELEQEEARVQKAYLYKFRPAEYYIILGFIFLARQLEKPIKTTVSSDVSTSSEYKTYTWR